MCYAGSVRETTNFLPSIAEGAYRLLKYSNESTNQMKQLITGSSSVT
jgi:hypothetical protein